MRRIESREEKERGDGQQRGKRRKGKEEGKTHAGAVVVDVKLWGLADGLLDAVFDELVEGLELLLDQALLSKVRVDDDPRLLLRDGLHRGALFVLSFSLPAPFLFSSGGSLGKRLLTATGRNDNGRGRARARDRERVCGFSLWGKEKMMQRQQKKT